MPFPLEKVAIKAKNSATKIDQLERWSKKYKEEKANTITQKFCKEAIAHTDNSQ